VRVRDAECGSLRFGLGKAGSETYITKYARDFARHQILSSWTASQ
jgi:hypothetical protein